MLLYGPATTVESVARQIRVSFPQNESFLGASATMPTAFRSANLMNVGIGLGGNPVFDSDIAAFGIAKVTKPTAE